MAIALITLLLLEVVLLLAWVPAYFSRGFVVFNHRIGVLDAAHIRVLPNDLEWRLASPQWYQLLFRTLPDGRIAFRESFGLSFARRYFPVMRGLIEVHPGRREARVVGRCSWSTLCIGLGIFPVIALRPAAAPLLLVLPLFALSYWLQRRRYLAVVAAVRDQLDPRDFTQSSHFPARPAGASADPAGAAPGAVPAGSPPPPARSAPRR